MSKVAILVVLVALLVLAPAKAFTNRKPLSHSAGELLSHFHVSCLCISALL
jgi:hypothetical protein